MKNATLTSIIGSALAALTIGLAAPAFAAPSGPGDRDGNGNGHGTSQFSGYPQGGRTPYGTYQNDDSRPGGPR